MVWSQAGGRVGLTRFTVAWGHTYLYPERFFEADMGGKAEVARAIL